MHEKGFIHRDLTSMNILLQSENTTQNLKAIVADFGLSERIPEFPKILPQVGSQNWMAPEVLREEFYNEKVRLDIKCLKEVVIFINYSGRCL